VDTLCLLRLVLMDYPDNDPDVNCAVLEAVGAVAVGRVLEADLALGSVAAVMGFRPSMPAPLRHLLVQQMMAMAEAWGRAAFPEASPCGPIPPPTAWVLANALASLGCVRQQFPTDVVSRLYAGALPACVRLLETITRGQVLVSLAVASCPLVDPMWVRKEYYLTGRLVAPHVALLGLLRAQATSDSLAAVAACVVTTLQVGGLDPGRFLAALSALCGKGGLRPAWVMTFVAALQTEVAAVWPTEFPKPSEGGEVRPSEAATASRVTTPERSPGVFNAGL
jgi:hypothetical protein